MLGWKRILQIHLSRHRLTSQILSRKTRKRRNAKLAAKKDIQNTINKKFIRLSKALVQYCWAHLVRDIKFLLTLGNKTLKRWAKALLNILRKIFRLWKTRHGRHFGRYQKSIEKLKKVFLQKVRRPPDHNEAKNIRNRFVDGIEKCYLCGNSISKANPRKTVNGYKKGLEQAKNYSWAKTASRIRKILEDASKSKLKE